MRLTISLLLLSLLPLTGCQEIREMGAVVVISNDRPAGKPSSPGTPPAQAPAHGQRAKASPPPHAPAHGQRYRHASGLEMEYDSGLGVYVVLNHADVFFHDNVYLRFFNDNWIVSARFDGPWESARESQIPEKLKTSRKANKGNNTGGNKGDNKRKGNNKS